MTNVSNWVNENLPAKKEIALETISKLSGSKVYGNALLDAFVDAVESFNEGGTASLKVTLDNQDHSGCTWAVMAHALYDTIDVNINAL